MKNSAADFFAMEDFESALSLYAELSTAHPDNSDYVFKTGICTFEAGDKPRSLLFFLKAYQLGLREPRLYLYLAQAYHFNFDFDNALYYAEYFLSKVPDGDATTELRAQAMALRDQILNAKNVLDKRLSVDIGNMGGEINSEFADYVPMLAVNDSVMFFTSRRSSSTGGRVALDGFHFEDIYFSKQNKDGTWQPAGQFSQFNGKHHDANVAINRTGTELYIYKAKRKGDIFKSTRLGKNKWSRPKRLKGISSRAWEGSICLSPSEDTLYFSSDRRGGFGGSDLYRATKDQRGNWTDVVNLGGTINTELDEDAPYLHKDGKTLFFSSKGHSSIGGYDIFSAKYINNEWTNIKNVGFPLNSIGDDIYFQLNDVGSIGYFTSFRYSNFKEKSIGEKDIFQIKRPFSSPVYFVFKGRIFDAETREPIPAIVSMINLDDTTQQVQRLVVDINSGKFRYDLKFDTRYRINVEVAGKQYYSKELYYPYQPELFESFLDIPLKDVPVFKMRLSDIVLAEQDTSKNLVLNDSKVETIVLVRKVAIDDVELRDLLVSARVPVSFRRKIYNQLQEHQAVDDKEEGDLTADLLAEMRKTLPEEPAAAVVFSRLDERDNNDIVRMFPKDLVTSGVSKTSSAESDSLTFSQLSKEEQALVERMSQSIMQDTMVNAAGLDEVFYLNLTAEERKRVKDLVRWKIRQNFENDSSRSSAGNDQLLARLANFLNNDKTSGAIPTPLRTYNKGAWGLLHTVDAASFRHDASTRVVFDGHVVFRNSNKQAPGVPLLLTDDNGMIYAHKSTDDAGEISFDDLLPGRRYHILVNDVTIQLLGISRYEMLAKGVTEKHEDYQAFYSELSPEDKRSVDRLIAAMQAKEDNEENPTATAQSQMDLEKLGANEKVLLEKIKKYLKASSMSEDDFFLEKSAASDYEQMDIKVRTDLNAVIASQTVLIRRDSSFYEQLDQKQKDFIDLLRKDRHARHTLLEDVLPSRKESNYWYVLDEINTKQITSTKSVSIEADLVKKAVGVSWANIALMDESNEIQDATTTDTLGVLYFSGVEPNKRYKVLFNVGEDIANLSDYKLRNVRIRPENDTLFAELSAADRRMINRIIAIKLAEESYANKVGLKKADALRAGKLSPEQRQFVDRLRRHLFADSIGLDDLYLDRRDNATYYGHLTRQEREFINRTIVKSHFESTLFTDSISLAGREKKFYDHLSEQSKQTIGNMLRQRRAEADLFAEDPVLMADKAWVLLDSTVNDGIHEGILSLKMQVVNVADSLPAANVQVMITNSKNEVMGIVGSGADGSLSLSNLPANDDYYILAQTTGGAFSVTNRFAVKDLKRIYGDTPQSEDSTYMITVYFDFDQRELSLSEQSHLRDQLKNITMRFKVIVEGHADSRGSIKYNMRLSLDRARFVSHVLLRSGIADGEIRVIGYGEGRPLQGYRGSDVKQRRVEIRLVK